MFDLASTRELFDAGKFASMLVDVESSSLGFMDFFFQSLCQINYVALKLKQIFLLYSISSSHSM